MIYVLPKLPKCTTSHVLYHSCLISLVHTYSSVTGLTADPPPQPPQEASTSQTPSTRLGRLFWTLDIDTQTYICTEKFQQKFPRQGQLGRGDVASKMPALRENSEAEPLLTGNGGVGQHQGDGNQLGKWCYMEYLYTHTT